MKKGWLALVLTAALLAAGCGDKEAVPPVVQEEDTAESQLAETDFYTLELDKDWQWEVVRYAADIPTGDVIFYDGQKKTIGGGAIVIAPNDDLADLPDQIRVIHQQKTEEGWITGKIEVVGNAAGGDTSSEYHVLIPLSDERQMHEYIDLYLEGQHYDETQLEQLAETVIIRNQQLFGFVLGLEEDRLQFVRGEWVDSTDSEKIQSLGLTEADLARGFAIAPDGERQTLTVSPEVRYYLVDTEDALFKEVEKDDFLANLTSRPKDVYDLTLRDGAVVSIEERVL